MVPAIFSNNNSVLPQFVTNSIQIIHKSLHRFVKTCNEYSQTAWESFKARIQQKSQDEIYIEQLNQAEAIEWEEHHHEKLAEILSKVNPYSPQGYALKQLFKKCDCNNLEAILKLTFNKIFESSHFNFDRVLKFLDLDSVKNATGVEYEFIVQEIQEMRDCLPASLSKPIPSFYSQLSKTMRVVTRFFPRFMDTFLKAFNLLEAGKAPETMWDFSAMFDIYFKIFMIPYGIFFIVGSVVGVSTQAFLITAAVLAVAVVGVCLYIKYRPLPTDLPRARNLTEEAKNSLEPVVGREAEISEVSAYLGKKEDGFFTHLILVGDSGVGKTEILKGVAQQVKDKTIFALNAPALVHGYTPLEDKLGLLLLDIKGHTDEVVLAFEEFGDAVKKNPEANIGGCLKTLLDRNDVQVIAFATKEEYECIQKDIALAGRFTKFEVEKLEKEQTLPILQERMERNGGTILFEDGIADVIYTATEKKIQPRASVELLKKAMKKVRGFKIEEYVCKDLIDKRGELRQKRREYQEAIRNFKKTTEIVNAIRDLKLEIRNLEAENTAMVNRAKNTKRLIEVRRLAISKRYELTQQKPGSKRLPFINWTLLPWLNEKIEEESGEIKGIPLFVNEDLINQIL